MPGVDDGQFFGVVCVDVTLSYLFSDIYESLNQLSYSFVMDSRGRLLEHPMLPRPTSLLDDTVFLQMSLLEPGDDADDVRLSMLRYVCKDVYNM